MRWRLVCASVGYRGPDDVGLAVATDHGVVIPVVHGVLGRDAASLAEARTAAVERARAGRLSAEDLGASPPSTLSNLGSFGVDQFTGIIALRSDESSHGGSCSTACSGGRQADVEDPNEFFATLNADHRVIDGAAAARLLAAFATAAEAMTSTF